MSLSFHYEISLPDELGVVLAKAIGKYPTLKPILVKRFWLGEWGALHAEKELTITFKFGGIGKRSSVYLDETKSITNQLEALLSIVIDADLATFEDVVKRVQKRE